MLKPIKEEQQEALKRGLQKQQDQWASILDSIFENVAKIANAQQETLRYLREIAKLLGVENEEG